MFESDAIAAYFCNRHKAFLNALWGLRPSDIGLRDYFNYPDLALRSDLRPRERETLEAIVAFADEQEPT